MKICFLSGDRGISLEKHNGAAAHVRSLVRTFLKLGHDVTLATPSAGGEDLGVPIQRIPAPQVLNSLLDTSGREEKRMAHALGHIWNNVMVEQSLQSILTRDRPHLLFEVYSPYGISAGILARQMRIRHVLNVHAPLAWEGMHYRQQALQEAADALERIAFESAQMIIANSEELRQQLISAGVPSRKIAVVPNGVDTELFAPHGKKLWETPNGKIVIGFVGSLKAWHGIDILIAAFRHLVMDQRFDLLVVGDGPMGKALLKLSQEFPGRITFAGAIPPDQVPPYIRSMDITLAPYPPIERFYFSPLKVLEYMAAGKATVASDIGQIKQMIRDGETGLLVPPGDVPALVDAINRLSADDQLRLRIGKRAAEEARENHTWAQRASEIIEMAERIESP